MPRPTITSAQNKAIGSGFLDLMGESKALYEAPSFDALADSLAYVAQVYAKKLADQLKTKDANSSGQLADSIIPLDVKLFGSVYSVDIQALKYASFIDEGVSGWAQDRGSQYKFKTKGVNPDGDMVKSIKAWLMREHKISRLTRKITVSRREARRASITDTTKKAAITAAYMIKRQGIAPTHFWRDATREMDDVVREQFAKALRIDIITNLSDN